MNRKNIQRIIHVIEFIEANITKRLALSTISDAIKISPYHIHRIFSVNTGMTIHNYLRRRQLTEAARMLSFSNKPIIEIALLTGHENQQSFSKIFKSMYKYTPDSFRKNKIFYPLQHQFDFNDSTDNFHINKDESSYNIKLAGNDDIYSWMNLVRLVVDGYPFLDEEEHIKTVERFIERKQALIVHDDKMIIAEILFSKKTGNIDFLGIHPLYSTRQNLKIFIYKALFKLYIENNIISISTYREGDKADPGYRKVLKAIGFIESELLIEFGYPTQKFILHKHTNRGFSLGK